MAHEVEMNGLREVATDLRRSHDSSHELLGGEETQLLQPNSVSSVESETPREPIVSLQSCE